MHEIKTVDILHKLVIIKFILTSLHPMLFCLLSTFLPIKGLKGHEYNLNYGIILYIYIYIDFCIITKWHFKNKMYAIKKKKVYCDLNNDMQLNIWTFTQNGNKNAWN